MFERVLKSVGFVLLMIVVIFLAHHATVYIHEWTHGFIAWLTGYKSNPFAIHYGEKWITLLDIDESVPYDKILADGKPSVMAAIAISPILLQFILFPLGLVLLSLPKVQKHWFLFAFIFWWTFFELAQTYAYIPIRTFSKSDDIYNFVSTTGISPYMIAIPGTIFVIWGIYRMLTYEASKAFECLHISTRFGRLTFLFVMILLFFGYYGTPGYFKPDSISRFLTMISWSLAPLIFLLGVIKLTRKTKKGL